MGKWVVKTRKIMREMQKKMPHRIEQGDLSKNTNIHIREIQQIIKRQPQLHENIIIEKEDDKTFYRLKAGYYSITKP